MFAEYGTFTPYWVNTGWACTSSILRPRLHGARRWMLMRACIHAWNNNVNMLMFNRRRVSVESVYWAPIFFYVCTLELKFPRWLLCRWLRSEEAPSSGGRERLYPVSWKCVVGFFFFFSPILWNMQKGRTGEQFRNISSRFLILITKFACAAPQCNLVGDALDVLCLFLIAGELSHFNR